MNKWKPFLLANVSLPVLLFMLKPMTALNLANVLSLSYKGLGLTHLDKMTKI